MRQLYEHGNSGNYEYLQQSNRFDVALGHITFALEELLREELFLVATTAAWRIQAFFPPLLLSIQERELAIFRAQADSKAGQSRSKNLVKNSTQK